MTLEELTACYGLQLITPELAYLPATERPLSADVFLAEHDGQRFAYDAGASDEAAELLRAAEPAALILSHFHADHSGNLARLSFPTVYTGALRERHYENQIIVEEPKLLCSDGTLRLIPTPSSHSKGSLLFLAGEYLLTGDALYNRWKDGRALYNVQRLRAIIDNIEHSGCRYVIESHRAEPVCTAEEALVFLRGIYARRRPGESVIEL